jgi:glycosyltransferase involved in cell wall biosynthesis
MKKKIAFICLYSYPSICGVWSRVYNLSQMLINEGHEVHVFSTNIIKGTNEKSGSYEEYEKIKIHRFNPRISYKENLKFWNFSKELKIINPDIIIAEVYRHPHTSLALKISKELNKPCYLVTHAPFVEASLRTRFENFLVNSYDRIYGKKILNKFTKIIAITKWEIPYLLKIGISEKKICYIPNGIPEEFFKPKQKNSSGILFLGRISPIKDLETLIFAMNELIKVHPNHIGRASCRERV